MTQAIPCQSDLRWDDGLILPLAWDGGREGFDPCDELPEIVAAYLQQEARKENAVKARKFTSVRWSPVYVEVRND